MEIIVGLENLIGKTIYNIIVDKCYEYNHKLLFITDEYIYTFKHNKCCCHINYIEYICGDLNELIGKKLENINKFIYIDDMKYCGAHYAYKIITDDCCVDVSWSGCINNYVTGVDIYEFNIDKFIEKYNKHIFLGMIGEPVSYIINRDESL